MNCKILTTETGTTFISSEVNGFVATISPDKHVSFYIEDVVKTGYIGVDLDALLEFRAEVMKHLL